MLPGGRNRLIRLGKRDSGDGGASWGAALQGLFSSDFRSIAAGVTMTIVPILIFFIAFQRQFVRGLAGAVKG